MNSDEDIIESDSDSDSDDDHTKYIVHLLKDPLEIDEIDIENLKIKYLACDLIVHFPLCKIISHNTCSIICQLFSNTVKYKLRLLDDLIEKYAFSKGWTYHRMISLNTNRNTVFATNLDCDYYAQARHFPKRNIYGNLYSKMTNTQMITDSSKQYLLNKYAFFSAKMELCLSSTGNILFPEFRLHKVYFKDKIFSNVDDGACLN